MEVYGCDFSGSKNPAGKIWIARGRFDLKSIFIDSIEPCEDRLELASLILDTKAPWGLDFPFSFPEKAMETLGVVSWEKLLKLAAGMPRQEFMRLLLDKFERHETPCKEAGLYCRATDVQCKAKSPFKKVCLWKMDCFE